ATLGGRVWSIERDPDLSAAAAKALEAAGIDGVTLIVGDGTLGYPEAAPYDAINVAAAAREQIPSPLVEQLAPGGRLVVPVGEQLVFVSRDRAGRLLEPQAYGAVRFVPLI